MARILIVEDDQATAEQVRAALARAGHECKIELSGTAALEAAKRYRAELIVLDVMLPGTSGFEICRRVRRDADLYMLPVLILSAMNAEEEMLHGLAQGADDYVPKPFNPNDLAQRIEALLRSRSDGHAVDETTSLPGADSTKRELQRRIGCHETFAAVYVELVRAREFGLKYGAEARAKAIRHLGRALRTCGEKLEYEEFFVGHMGGGHFVCLASPAGVDQYCEWVGRLWETHVQSLAQAAGPGQSTPSDENAARGLLDILFCVTLREAKEPVTPQLIFETLSQIRHKALESSLRGVHFDRRTFHA